MVISKRLKAIADMVDTKVIYDIGCDHAYLDIYLAKNKGVNAVAIDIKDEIVATARKNVEKENMSHKVTVMLNDGLEGIEIKDDETAIISGLGTNNILKILKGKRISNIIVQSNDDIKILRRTMTRRGYYIADEKMIFEDRYYTIISFKKGVRRYSGLELEFGPVLTKNMDSTFVSFLEKEEQYYKKLIKKVPFRYVRRRYNIRKILYYIKMTLNK